MGEFLLLYKNPKIDLRKESLSKKGIERMTDQVFFMGRSWEKESAHKDKKVFVPTLVRILESLKIVQIAAGQEATIFLTSEGVVLEIVKYNKSGNPFLKHEIPEPIDKIVAGLYFFFALSSQGNVYGWRNNGANQLGFPGREEDILSPRMIPFFSEKGLRIEEVVCSSFNSYFLCEGGDLYGAGESSE